MKYRTIKPLENVEDTIISMVVWCQEYYDVNHTSVCEILIFHECHLERNIPSTVLIWQQSNFVHNTDVYEFPMKHNYLKDLKIEGQDFGLYYTKNSTVSNL
ncbi:hypothetical protein C922_05561 [Plasmodium inui San Antonio 1]|uniref:Uncharacterized protein n=1 Tax=Plasmodium inui San Antonio 1 TaxID=1237626 RepID=W7A4N4_9APIC|nr:hypothetical protein C922_05561 [Plasmodium inui San Antonio 1]EUD64054.1 hypothetical protein C922_05561 [Plasmodium inui San Antonio 1]